MRQMRESTTSRGATIEQYASMAKRQVLTTSKSLVPLSVAFLQRRQMAQVPKVRCCDLLNGNKSLPDPTIVSNLPDLLSPHFNGHETDLKRIRDSFALNYGGYVACCAIYGCSGLGKTQVALKYALDAYNSSICHVF